MESYHALTMKSLISHTRVCVHEASSVEIHLSLLIYKRT